MNKRLITIAATLIAILAMALPAGAASPASARSAQLSGSQCPAGKLVINVTHKVVNDIDSGVAGNYWAVDEYNRHIQVWQVGPDTFCAVASYAGSFVTVAGASPQTTDLDGILAGITGTFEGGYVSNVFHGTLNSSPSYSTRGNIGTFDYGCDPTTGVCTGLFSWRGTYFSSAPDFDLSSWGWTYHGGKNGTWVNSSDGNQGDITD